MGVRRLGIFKGFGEAGGGDRDLALPGWPLCSPPKTETATQRGVGMGELRGGNRKSDGWESPNASPASKTRDGNGRTERWES